MAEVGILAAVGVCFAQIAWAWRRPNGVIEYPFLIAWVYLGFILPQAFRIAQIKTLPEGSADHLVLMVLICATAGFVGYTRTGLLPPLQKHYFDSRRMAQASCLMAISGAYFYWKLYSLPDNVLANSQWTGAPVLYLFFAQLLTFGFYLAFAVYLKSRERFAIPALVIGLVLFVGRVVVTGRRGPAIELVLALLVTAWFVRSWRPPRALVVAAIPIAIVGVNGIGVYRSTVFEGGRYGVLRDVSASPLTRVAAGLTAVAGRADELIAPSDAIEEVQNAAIVIESCNRTRRFDMGASLWNDLIHRYVPGQLVGHDLKRSLTINLPPLIDPSINYRVKTGATLTGLSDSYASFGYLGGVNFFLIGVACRWLWEQASEGKFAAVVGYAVMTRSSLESLTHSTHHFPNAAVAFMIFVVPVLYYCRITPTTTKRYHVA